MKTNDAVALRIQKLCGERGITICGLAGKAGVSRSTIKNILYGRSKNPGITTIKIICDAFGIPLKTFFSSEEFDNLTQEIN